MVAAGAARLRGTSGDRDQAAFVDFFMRYDQAFMAKNLAQLAAFYHPDVTVYEGGGINPGWADYRDRHLGPELKAFANLKFEHINIVGRLIGPDAAYVTGEYLLDATNDGKEIRSGGLATYVMIREAGAWRTAALILSRSGGRTYPAATPRATARTRRPAGSRSG